MSAITPRVGIVLGTRPEVIKNWSIVQALRARGVAHFVLHTNQHSDWSMQGAFFSELGYSPDHVLPGDYALGRAVDWVRALVSELRLDVVLVNGDTAASLVGAIAAMYSDVAIAHVEAGLRSYDREMYEERNRIMVDAAAHFLFTYTEKEEAFLRARPELRGQVHHVGNTTVDLIDAFAAQLEPTGRDRFAFVTLHRKELTDRPAQLLEVFGALRTLTDEIDVVFPMHPRTRDAMARHRIPRSALGDVVVTEPMGCMDALAHVRGACVVLTDSGCVQEEACILRTPCVTVRDNTERLGTIEIGANVLSGMNGVDIVEAARLQMARAAFDWPPIYGQPGAAGRIADILCREWCRSAMSRESWSGASAPARSSPESVVASATGMV
jgi:UDP-N-acetylglucosamine 2-epimerase